MTCTCGSIGAPQEIRQCPEHFHYWFGDQRYASIGSVIKSVLPTDYSMVQQIVLENARQRGVFVDRWFCEYIMTGDIDVPAGCPQEYDDYLSRVINWWDKSGLKALATQRIVYSSDGIAGMYDIWLAGDMIVDLKCVSARQPSYKLQLGAYVSMADDTAPGVGIGILHATKTDVKLVPYSTEDCRANWRAAVDWWKVKKRL